MNKTMLLVGSLLAVVLSAGILVKVYKTDILAGQNPRSLLAESSDNDKKSITASVRVEDDTLVWSPLGSATLERPSLCVSLNYEPEQLAQHKDGIKKRLKEYQIRKEIKDLSEEHSLADSSAKHATEMLNLLKKSLEKLNANRKATSGSYSLILRPTSTEFPSKYESISGMRSTCLASRDQSSKDRPPSIVGYIEQKTGRVFGDDPNGQKKVNQVIKLWEKFVANKGSLGVLDIPTALSLANGFDLIIPSDDTKITGPQASLALTVNNNCFDVLPDQAQSQSTMSNYCVDEKGKKEMFNTISEKMSAKIQFYTQKASSYDAAAKKLQARIDEKKKELAALPQ